ncbi:MAG: hypothetical protein A2178_01230 [Planctomycetes bacterium GWC2_49_10]|nr:MAG: hypothetical protein A2178_01230 [Planctomycetes bacterium GWC2_49_10]
MGAERTKVVIFVFALIAIILAFGFQGTRGIWQPDEGYYVGAATNMMRLGDLMLPRLGEHSEQIFLDKPPVVYWGIIAGLKVFGHTEFGARAFHATCYLFTILLVYLLGKAMYHDRNKALWAGVIYATMILPFFACNFVTPDTPLVMWVTLAALCFWKSIEPERSSAALWKILICVAGGFGFLTKGPAVFIPCGAMFVYLALTRRLVKYMLSPALWVGLAVFCVVGLGWYAWVAKSVPGGLAYLVDNQVWGRLISAKYNRNPGLVGAFIYIPVIIGGTMPWSIICLEKIGKVRNTLFTKAWLGKLPSGDPAGLFLLCWIVVPLVILSLASSRLGLYALPVFPAIALALARSWSTKINLFDIRQLWKNPAFFRSPATAICIWVVALLGAKIILANMSSYKDTRRLWAAMQSFIPEKVPYEIITVDDHADGLMFYGAAEVENVTLGKKTYPTFVMPEHFRDELKGFFAENETLLILLRNKRREEAVINDLNATNTSFRKVLLPYERTLFIVPPKIGI